MTIYDNYKRVAEDVARVCREAGRTPEEVTLVGASKTVEVPAIASAVKAGCMDLGENRPDRILATSAAYPSVRWHFIGNVQGRRIADIVPVAHLIHSVYKAEHLPKIEAAAVAAGKVQRILLEVNVSGEESKGGVSAAELPGLLDAAAALEHVNVCGLMTMAPQGDIDCARRTFEGLRELRDEYAAHGFALTELSMGMSEDWQCAIEQGATIVRIGRAIFSDSFAD